MGRGGPWLGWEHHLWQWGAPSPRGPMSPPQCHLASHQAIPCCLASSAMSLTPARQMLAAKPPPPSQQPSVSPDIIRCPHGWEGLESPLPPCVSLLSLWFPVPHLPSNP